MPAVLCSVQRDCTSPKVDGIDRLETGSGAYGLPSPPTESCLSRCASSTSTLPWPASRHTILFCPQWYVIPLVLL